MCVCERESEGEVFTRANRSQWRFLIRNVCNDRVCGDRARRQPCPGSYRKGKLVSGCVLIAEMAFLFVSVRVRGSLCVIMCACVCLCVRGCSYESAYAFHHLAALCSWIRVLSTRPRKRRCFSLARLLAMYVARVNGACGRLTRRCGSSWVELFIVVSSLGTRYVEAMLCPDSHVGTTRSRYSLEPDNGSGRHR